MRITAALLAEKAETRGNGLYVEGGVFPAVREEVATGQLVVWLVVLVERGAPTDDRTFKVEVVSLEQSVADSPEEHLPIMEVSEASLAAKIGFSIHELRLSRSDIPSVGWDAVVVTDPHGDSFTLPFNVAALPAA
ncbi:MAG: hypothetical protein JWR11_4599 [Mycobacterium sp.]|nr:hypothetical protein [Mycobacterium sp.]